MNGSPEAEMAKTKSNGSWNVDLFHCAPGGSVFSSIFQPCVLYGRAEERLRNPYLENYNGSNEECQKCCKISLCVFGPMGCVYVKRQREKIREKYGISGSSGSDCAVSTFCCCCALVQHDNEIESRSARIRVVDKAGYRANTHSMHMPERGSWYMTADARTSQYGR